LPFLTVTLENRIKYSSDIFDHYRPWPNFIRKPQCHRKQVTLVISPELLSSNRKWRAWKPSSQQFHPPISLSFYGAYVLTDHIPLRSVFLQRCAGMPINFYKANVAEPSPFNA